MSDYTPTEGDVRQRYIGHNGSYWTWPEQCEFDRWLAQHDAEVAARALRKAANHNAFETGLDHKTFLRREADRIEREAGR